jgi:hypothetical protein
MKNKSLSFTCLKQEESIKDQLLHSKYSRRRHHYLCYLDGHNIREKIGDLARGVYRAVDSSFISTQKILCSIIILASFSSFHFVSVNNSVDPDFFFS